MASGHGGQTATAFGLDISNFACGQRTPAQRFLRPNLALAKLSEIYTTYATPSMCGILSIRRVRRALSYRYKPSRTLESMDRGASVLQKRIATTTHDNKTSAEAPRPIL